MTTTKADELAAELEADGFSPKAHYGAAAELRRLSAVEAERDALQRQVQEMALQALADDTQHREVEAERDALLAAIPEGCTPADAKTLREANHLLSAERDALKAELAQAYEAHAELEKEGDELLADAMRYRWLRDKSEPPHNFYISVPVEFHGVGYQPSEVDAYIDAARATGEQQ